MTRLSKALVAALVVLAALAGGVGHVGAATTAPTAQEDCSFPTTVTDSTGTEMTIEEEPGEIVVLGASSAQTVWELGEQDKVTGMPVAPSTAYLNGSDSRTHVLDGQSVQTETVVDLDPDLVIAPGGGFISEDDIQALRDAGLTVYVEDGASSIDAVKENTETTGQLLGACDAAEETTSWMDERLSVVEEAAEGEDSPSVFYWLGGGYTAGSGTFQGDLLVTAGAENAAANMGIEGWATAEPEAIVAEDPDYILVTEGTELPEDHPIQETTAVQEGNVITVDNNYWNQAAPRVVLAVEEITQQLHGEAYEEATSDDGASEDAGNESDGSDDDAEDGDSENESNEDDSDSVPGFGVPAAAAALIGALLVLARRP